MTGLYDPRTYNIHKQNIDLISWNKHVSRCAMQSWTSHRPSEPHPVEKVSYSPPNGALPDGAITMSAAKCAKPLEL